MVSVWEKPPHPMPPRRQHICGKKDCQGQHCGECDSCLEAKYDQQRTSIIKI